LDRESTKSGVWKKSQVLNEREKTRKGSRAPWKNTGWPAMFDKASLVAKASEKKKKGHPGQYLRDRIKKKRGVRLTRAYPQGAI